MIIEISVLTDMREGLSRILQENLTKNSEKKWYKLLLQSAGHLDIAIKLLNKEK